MSVLVDTPIWSYALRSPDERFRNEVDELVRLVRNGNALIIGPIRQEILSGYSNLNKFHAIREKLAGFENTPVLDSDYESAAEFNNICRTKGIQGSHTDFLICAVAKRLGIAVFTTDKDFVHYRRVISVHLHSSRNGGG